MIRFATALAVAMLIAAPAVTLAQKTPAPFAKGDTKAGKVIVDRDCVACHAQKFAGDPDRMYTRPEHRIKTPSQLLSQVQACNTNLGKGYFPEEEEHIAAYLNLEFYKFKP
jgi:cytochrome c5